MIRNSVKHKLREGGVSIGTMLFEFNTTGIAHRRQRGCRLRSVRHGTLWLEHRNNSNADCHHAEVRAGSDRPHPGNRVSLRRERARHGSDGSHDPDVRERRTKPAGWSAPQSTRPSVVEVPHSRSLTTTTAAVRSQRRFNRRTTKRC